jgi:AAA-like domain
MAKEFNITGTCFPEDHYMADVSSQMLFTYEMIEKGKYFIINRPRQYGKTTTIYTMSERLYKSGNYLVFNMSFEGIGDAPFSSEESFANTFVRLLTKSVKRYDTEIEAYLKELSTNLNVLEELGDVILKLAKKSNKKIVVLIDEVDKSSNNQLFVNFLALLRNLYLDRKDNPTFHSVVLAGVHDVKTLKIKLRPDETKTLNSPWNISTDFLVNMNFSPIQIQPMLEDYAQEQGVKLDSKLIAEKLFFYTSGYPYLTSHLCKIIAEEILPNRAEKEWTEQDVYKAFQLILRKRNNTNFDTLIKNLREYSDLYQLTFALVVEGQTYSYNDHNSTMSLGILHGIYARSESDKLMIHNRIYREIVGDMMVSEWRTKNSTETKNKLDGFDGFDQYQLPNNGLDMQTIMEKFQTFMRTNYSTKDRDFLERDGRLIFLAFLRPIINGAGHEFKEPQISEERRLDVVITFHQHQYVAEMKIWHGEVAHQKGLLQLANYLDSLGLDTGYLLIFDHNKKKSWKKDWVEVEGKKIFWVKV